jgi:Tol biopolymer transport system component
MANKSFRIPATEGSVMSNFGNCNSGTRCYRLPAGLLLAYMLAWGPSAAQGQQSAIYAIDVESGETVKVSHKDEWWLGSAGWSHDGKKLAYVGAENSKKWSGWQILVESLEVSPDARPEDRAPKDLGPGDGPCWSPDDEQIVFYLDVRNSFGIKPGVWIMNADGTGRDWLCEGTRPRWSPEGDRIAMVSGHEGFPSLYIFDTVSLERTRVLDRGYDYLVGASWSPDGKQLVYTGFKNGQPFRGGQGEVAIVDAAADAKPEVAAKGEVGWHPDWSPDGKQIVFWISNGNERLHLLDVGSAEPPRLLPGQSTARNSDPVWSFDGKKIAFSSDR